MPQSTMSQSAISVDNSAYSGGTQKNNLLLDLTPQEQLLAKSFVQQVEHTLFVFGQSLHKQKKISARWSHAAFFIVAFQILSLITAGFFDWASMIHPFADFLSIFATTHRSHPFASYMFMLWGCVATVVVACALVAFSIRLFFKSETATLPAWVQKAIQISAHTLPGIFYLPFLSTMVLVFHCEDVGDTSLLVAINDKDVTCWGLEHITYMIITSPALLLFVTFSFCFTCILFEFNPTSDTISSRMHSRVDLFSFIGKTAIIVCHIFFREKSWIPWISLFVWALGMTLLHIILQPFYRSKINHMRSGVYASLLFATICLGVNLLKINGLRDLIAIIFYAGLVPAFFVGRKISSLRAKLLVEKFVKDSGEYSARFEEAPDRQPGQAWSQEENGNEHENLTGRKKSLSMFKKFTPANWKYALIYFSCPVDGAIIARELCIQEKIAGHISVPSKDEIAKADDIFSDELEKNPESILLLLSYMNFLIHFAQQADKFRIHGDKINLLEPAIDIRFIIFCANKELEQQRQTDGAGSGSMDLASYIEFQNSYKEARKYHSEALKSIRRFWNLLLVDDEKFDLELLPEAAKTINAATSAAQYHYESLLRRHPESTRLFRAYAEFLLGATHDSKKANAFLRRADELEEIQSRRRTEDRKQGALGSNFSTNIDMDDKTRAIITIDGKGTIQNINHTCSKMLQYSKAEVVGSNIKMLMPSPYSENHDTYLANYHRTGVKKVLGSVRSLDAKAKNGDIIPIRLSVHQTDVNGQVFFVGMLERQDDTSCMLSVNANGTVMNCNQVFSKKFGRETREISGRNFGEYFSGQGSESSLAAINFEEVYGATESIKLHGYHADGRFIQVIMAPKKVARDGTVHYRCTFEFLDEIEVSISIDPNGIIKTSNHFVKHVFGRTREEIIGEKINMLMPDPYRTFHDTYLQTYMHTGIKNVLDSSRVVEGQHKDKSRFKLHLLVSEGEINGAKIFSARATFARKTETPTCRLTVASTGIINNHSETALKMFDSMAQLNGVNIQKIIKFTSPKLNEMEFLDALRSQCGQGPISVCLTSTVHRGAERRDMSIEVIQQDLSGDTFFIIRVFDVNGADVIATLSTSGELMSGNDLLSHLMGFSMGGIYGKFLGDYVQVQSQRQVASFVLNTPDDNSEKPRTNFQEFINIRTNAVIKHRDETLLPIYFEMSHSGEEFLCRIARRDIPRSASASLVNKKNDKDIDIEIEDNHFAKMELQEIQETGNESGNDEDNMMIQEPEEKKKRKGTPPGVSFASAQGEEEEEDVENEIASASDSKAKTKKRGKGDSEEGGSEHGSSEEGSHHETSASSVRRVQRLRRKYQQSNHQNKSISVLRFRVIIGLIVLVGLSLGLYGGINILASSQSSAGISVSLCGNAILFHRSIYLNLQSIVLTPECEPSCSWNKTELYQTTDDDTSALENSFMALYLQMKIPHVYDLTKNYIYYDDVIPPYANNGAGPSKFASHTLQSLFVDDEIKLQELTDNGTSQMPFIRAVRTYIFYARFLSKPDNWNDPLAPRYLHFILQNGPDSIGDTWNAILTEYDNLASLHSRDLELIQTLVVAIALFLLISMGIFVLRPSFNKVHEERFAALRLFLLIPKSVVRTLSRIRITLESSGSGSDNSDGEEHHDDLDDHMEEGNGTTSKGKSRSNSSGRKELESNSKGHIFSIMKNKKMKEEKKKQVKQYAEPVPEEGQQIEPNKRFAWLSPIRESIEKFTQTQIMQHLRMRPMTKKWLSILFLLSLCFAAVTLYGYMFGKTTRSAASQIYYASQLSSLSQDISYYTIQMTSTNVNGSIYQQKLTRALDGFKLRLDCLTHGCPELGLIRSDNDGSHASLFYSNECFFKDPSFCLAPSDSLYELSITGVVNIATEFERSAYILSLLNSNIPITSTDFDIVIRGQSTLLKTGLASVIDNYSDELTTNSWNLKKGQGIIAGVTSAFMVVSFFIFFRPMFHALQDENRQTKAMLLMIPDEVVANTKEIEEFIASTDS